jgi:hypothetical protein
MTKTLFLPAALSAATCTAFLVSPVSAVKTTDDDFVPLSELKPLEQTEGYTNKHSYAYGLTAANTLINKKGYWVEKNKTSYINDQGRGLFIGNYRPFFRYLRDERHTFNVRGRFEYRYNPSLPDNPQLRGGEVVSNGTYSLEMLNAELDFDRHKLTVGRAFYRMGRGLLFANFADGAEYTGNFRYLQVKALAAYSGEYGGCTISLSGCRTNPDSDIKAKATFDIVPGRPIDANVPDPGRRYFVGTEIQSAQIFGSRLYLLGLYSRDMSRDAAKAGSNAGKIYAFDPLYLGAGLQGYIVTPRLRYVAEGIAERGKTYAASTGSGSSLTNTQVNIDAWALTADVNYSLPLVEKMLKPGLILQYAYATGRDSATPRPANPAQEATGATDNNFYSFGVYSAGLALQPRLNNLHVLRLGAQFRPLNRYYWGRNLMVATKYTIYRKGNANYGISDVDAKQAKSDIGRALDIQAVWDFRSDLKFFYAYGYFTPGEAYQQQDAKTWHSHIISLNLIF